jgi:hypothetical protein
MADKILKIHSAVEGFYRITKSLPGEEPHYDSGWFKNLITNTGLDQIGNGLNGMAFCQVGSGNAAPAVTNTQLSSFVASQGQTSSSNGVNNVSGNYYGWQRRVYTFAQGAAAGNLAEVGVSTQSASGQLFSRALIVDGSGNPTTLTVLNNEILTVTYEYRMHYSELDVNSSINISGTTYALTLRPSDVTSANWWSTYLPSNWAGANVGWYQVLSKESQTLNPITTTHNTGYLDGIPLTEVAYVNGNYYKERTVLIPIGSWNYATGIGAISYSSGLSSWQLSFSPKIPKDNTKTLQLRLRWTWARL